MAYLFVTIPITEQNVILPRGIKDNWFSNRLSKNNTTNRIVFGRVSGVTAL